MAGVHIVDGNARRAHDVAVGLLRGVAHNHQIRLEGDDGFNIEVGIVRHLQLLGAGGKVLGPVDNAAGGDGDHRHAHLVERQHRRGGQARHVLRHRLQHHRLGIAALLHIGGIFDGHARGLGFAFARFCGRVRRVARLQQVDERVQAVDDLYALGGDVFAGKIDDIVIGDGAELLPEAGFLREGLLIDVLNDVRRRCGGRNGEDDLGVERQAGLDIRGHGARGGIDHGVGEVLKRQHGEHTPQIALGGLEVGAGRVEEDHHRLDVVRGGIIRSARFDGRKFRLDFRGQLLGAKRARQRDGFLARLGIGDGRAFAGVVYRDARVGELLAVGLLLVAADDEQVRLHGDDGLGVKAGHARGDDGQLVHPVGILHRRCRLCDRHGLDAAAHEDLQRGVGQADDALGHLVEHQRLAFALLKVTRVIQLHLLRLLRDAACEHGRAEDRAQSDGQNSFQHTCFSPFSSWVSSSTRLARSS